MYGGGFAVVSAGAAKPILGESPGQVEKKVKRKKFPVEGSGNFEHQFMEGMAMNQEQMMNMVEMFTVQDT
jgi:hypothetical protein